MVNSLPMGERGPKLLTTRDWVFGSRPRRLALAALLNSPAPRSGWTREAVARAAEVSMRGIDAHLDGFERLGLIERTPTGVRRVEPTSALARDLRRLLATLDEAVRDER
jgi:hypothetical protein